MTLTEQPRVLFYVQHLLGIGHLMRARHIALALDANGFQVTLVTGGLPVAGFDDAIGVDVISLPPIAVRDGHFGELVDADGRSIDEPYKARRRQSLLDIYNAVCPDIVMLEAFPFGRRQLRFELLPLIDAIQASEPKPLLVTSIRDVLQRNRKAGRNEETANLLKQYFDKILVHGDANFAMLDETFPFATKLADKIVYTGLVSGPRPEAPSKSPSKSPSESPSESFTIVVSAGGGAVGAALLRASIQAAALLPDIASWCVITGPNLPQAEFDALAESAPANCVLQRFRTDFAGLLSTAELSISQAGYNTVSDILQAPCRALLIPFSSHGETEQTDRAERLNKLGLATNLSSDVLSDNALAGEKMAKAIRTALLQEPPALASSINLDGANGTANALRSLLRERHGSEA